MVVDSVVHAVAVASVVHAVAVASVAHTVVVSEAHAVEARMGAAHAAAVRTVDTVKPNAHKTSISSNIYSEDQALQTLFVKTHKLFNRLVITSGF